MLNFEKMNQTFNLRMGKVFTVHGDGNDGASAYEIAVENGFRGTEAEWLESLKGVPGQPGANGKTAYQYAKEGGYTGTESEFAAKMAKDIPAPYTLPVATAETLGGVKIGNGLVMDGEKLNADLSDYYTKAETDAAIDAASNDGVYELIETISIEEGEIKTVNRTAEPNGTVYNFKKVYIEVTTPTHTEKIAGIIGHGGEYVTYVPEMITTHERGRITKCYMQVDCGMLNATAISGTNNRYEQCGLANLYPYTYGGIMMKAITEVKVQLTTADKYMPIGTVIKIMGVRA